MAIESRYRFVEPPLQSSLIEALGERAIPIRTANDLDPLLRRIGDSRYVVIGEASHGTHDFHLWRTGLTRKLIEERGFSMVAVEGDWPDFERIDSFVKDLDGSADSANDELRALHRWPTWMWANSDVAAFIEWVRDHNAAAPLVNPVGIHGLDIYSLWQSMEAVIAYLQRIDPLSAQRVRHAYECFAPYDQQATTYARSAALVSASCEADVLQALAELQKVRDEGIRRSPSSYFKAEQHALIAKHAEAYYRSMLTSGPTSWNLRDEHMVDTLDRLMDLRGPQSKVVVWAHNTHVGDARYTDMAALGQINVGQLLRERHSNDGVVLVGFATSNGSVTAASGWGAPAITMTLPDPQPGSLEDALDHVDEPRALFMFDSDESNPALMVPRGHRAIGVVYDPLLERYANYVPIVLPRTYDALLYIQNTRGLHPLENVTRREPDAPLTYPSAL